MFDEKLYNFFDRELSVNPVVIMVKSKLMSNEIISFYYKDSYDKPYFNLTLREFNYKGIKSKLLQKKIEYLNTNSYVYNEIFEGEYKEMFNILFPMVNRKDRIEKLLKKL